MDYEKEYKDALERARNLHKDAIDMEDSLRANMAEIIFPELKESEDERIRKALIKAIKMKAFPTSTCGGELFICGQSSDKCIAWLEKQETSYTGKDVDDAYLKGISDTKNEIERQYEANYQIRKDIATFIFNYRGDIKDRAKWMNYLGIKVSFTEVEQGGMSNKNDERLRKTTICFLKDFAKQGYENAVECIDWLEKQVPVDVKEEAKKCIELSPDIWHDVSLIPQEQQELLVEWDSEDATWHDVVFYHADTKTFWNCEKQIEGVTRWCYIKDLLGKQNGYGEE